MSHSPLSLRQGAASAFLDGRLSTVIRPATRLFANLAPGDLLWVREPYHLEGRFHGRSPTRAAELGALPFYAANLTREQVHQLGLGQQWPARNLLRIWHRHHARVLAARRVRLKEFAAEQALAEGFETVGAWAAAWDRDVSLFGYDLAWDQDPEVVHLEIQRVAAQLPEIATKGAAYLARKPAVVPRKVAMPPLRPPALAADGSTCPRCGARRAFGCAHQPPPALAP